MVIELKLKTKYMLAEQKPEWTVFYRKGNEICKVPKK